MDVIVAVLAILALWCLHSKLSTWFALPSEAPTYHAADFTRRNDPVKTLEYTYGTARPGNLPADYVVREPGGYTDYLTDAGKPSW
jgi:hypothetical protein